GLDDNGSQHCERVRPGHQGCYRPKGASCRYPDLTIIVRNADDLRVSWRSLSWAGLGCLAAGTLALGTLVACGSPAGRAGSGGPGGAGGVVSVVTSTNVYGDVVRQVAGDKVAVTSLISNPDADPHSYQADVRNQLALSKADIVVENGGGYDDFVDTMLRAAKN